MGYIDLPVLGSTGSGGGGSTVTNLATTGVGGVTGTLPIANGGTGVSYSMTNPYSLVNLSLASSIASSALTISIKHVSGDDPTVDNPVIIPFRSPFASTASYVRRFITAPVSITIPTSATLGTEPNQNYPIFIYALDNSGSVSMGVSLNYLDEGKLRGTSAITNFSDFPIPLYATSGFDSVPVRLIGRMTAQQASSGRWSSLPTEMALPPFENNSQSWISFPLRFTATGSPPKKGGTLTDNGQYSRMGTGPNMNIIVDYTQTSPGSSGSGTYLTLLPPGYQIDNSVFTPSIATNVYSGTGFIAADVDAYFAQVTAASTAGFRAILSNSTQAHQGWQAPLADFSSTALSVKFQITVPIKGWS